MTIVSIISMAFHQQLHLGNAQDSAFVILDCRSQQLQLGKANSPPSMWKHLHPEGSQNTRTGWLDDFSVVANKLKGELKCQQVFCLPLLRHKFLSPLRSAVSPPTLLSKLAMMICKKPKLDAVMTREYLIWSEAFWLWSGLPHVC